MRYVLSENSINISDLKDIALQAMARKYDVKTSNGKLEGEELLAFNKELKQQGIVTNIENLDVLKNPQRVLSDKNVITIVENYSKKNADTTLFGALMKNDSMSREDRKKALLAVFNIFYRSIYASTKTGAQKAELEELKTMFVQSVNEELDNSWFELTVDEDDVNDIVQKMLKMHTASSEELSGEIFDYIDNTMFSFGDDEFSYLLDSIDVGNVISVTQKFKKHPANTDNESLLRVLAQEYTLGDGEALDKQARIKKYVVNFFQAAKFDDTPYMEEARKLVKSILDSWDTTSNVLTGDIEKLEGLMDAVLVNKPADIAKSLYSLIDDNSYAVDRPDVRVLLDKINVSNVNDVLKVFETLGDKKSLLSMLDEEWVGDFKPKDYIKKIVLAQFNASSKSKDVKIKEHLNLALKNEKLSDVEALLDVVLVDKQTPKMLAKALFNQLRADEDNVNKEVVKYVLNSIDKDNVVKVLAEFNILSDNVPLTQFLQDNGEKSSLGYITKITNALFDANEDRFNSEAFSTSFKLKKEDLQKYVAKNITNKTDINWMVNSFLPANSKQIAQTLDDIASDKIGAVNDVVFKLWVAKINPENVTNVIQEYKELFDKNTPINVILEERGADPSTRNAQILYILSVVITRARNENIKIDESLLADFTNKLDKELFGFWPASASDLNVLLDKILKNTKMDDVKPEVIFNPDNLKLTNVRVDVPELSFGKKVGKYSWEYENLMKISSLEDVAKFTGLRVEFLNEMIEFEGYKNTPYHCSSGKLTIGIGHNYDNASDVDKKYLNGKSDEKPLSEPEIYRMFAYDLTVAIHGLMKSKNIETEHLTPGEYEALVDVSFNAPGYMNDLSAGTRKGIELRKQNMVMEAARVFEETSSEFNQQYSNGSLVAGLCKRRIENVLRYMDVENFAEVQNNPNAKKRIIILLKNGKQASPFYKESIYKTELCNILGITPEKYDELIRTPIKK